MEKNVLFLVAIVLMVFFLVSCNQPTAVDMGEETELDVIVEDSDIVQADLADDASRAFTLGWIWATNYTGIKNGSGPAANQRWKKARGRDGDRYYMRAVDSDNDASPNCTIVNDYMKYSPCVSYRCYLKPNKVYYVWIDGYGTNGNEDSVHVGLDTTQSSNIKYSYSQYLLHSYWNNSRWSFGGYRYPLGQGYRAKFEVKLSGFYNLNVWMRENGFRFGELYLTDDPNDVP